MNNDQIDGFYFELTVKMIGNKLHWAIGTTLLSNSFSGFGGYLIMLCWKTGLPLSKMGKFENSIRYLGMGTGVPYPTSMN